MIRVLAALAVFAAGVAVGVVAGACIAAMVLTWGDREP